MDSWRFNAKQALDRICSHVQQDNHELEDDEDEEEEKDDVEEQVDEAEEDIVL